MNTSLTIGIITRGWIARLFILLLWLVAIGLLFFTDEVSDTALVLLISCANIFLYSIVSSRLPLLVHQGMAQLLPGYFANIKKSLLIIIIASFIPTLLLLPNIILWLDVIAGLLMIAMLLIASSYQPKYSWLIVIIILSPYPIDNVNAIFENVSFDHILAYSAPLLALWSYYLLSKIETFKGNKKHVARMLALTSLSTKTALVIEDDLPIESRNKLWRWFINSNFAYFRNLIRADKKMSHSNMIATACQGVSSVGRTTYLFWTLAVVVFIIIGRLIPEESQHFLIPMMIIFPAMIIGTGTITVFQAVAHKKTLLQRLAIMPTFSKPKSFIKAFLTYVIVSQVKLYAFIAVVISALAITFHHLSLAMYINVFYGCIIICLLNLAVILFAWRGKKLLVGIGIWLMVVIFLSFMVLLLVVGDNQINLWQNHAFNTFAVIVTGLFISAFYKSHSADTLAE